MCRKIAARIAALHELQIKQNSVKINNNNNKNSHLKQNLSLRLWWLSSCGYESCVLLVFCLNHTSHSSGRYCWCLYYKLFDVYRCIALNLCVSIYGSLLHISHQMHNVWSRLEKSQYFSSQKVTVIFVVIRICLRYQTHHTAGPSQTKHFNQKCIHFFYPT